MRSRFAEILQFKVQSEKGNFLKTQFSQQTFPGALPQNAFRLNFIFENKGWAKNNVTFFRSVFSANFQRRHLGNGLLE